MKNENRMLSQLAVNLIVLYLKGIVGYYTLLD